MNPCDSCAIGCRQHQARASIENGTRLAHLSRIALFTYGVPLIALMALAAVVPAVNDPATVLGIVIVSMFVTACFVGFVLRRIVQKNVANLVSDSAVKDSGNEFSS